MADPLDLTSQVDVIPTENDNSLGNVLEKALEQHSESTPPVVADVPTEAPSRATDGTPPSTTPGETGQRQRDSFGKFAPKSAEPEPSRAPPSNPDENATPPQSWKVENRQLWDKVPLEVRPYLHQREQELQHGFQQIAQSRQIAEGVLNEFIPYAEQLQKEGATPVQAIHTLLQTAHQLRTGGPEYRKAILISLANQYQVDLSQPLNLEMAKVEAENANLSTEKLYGTAAQHQHINQQTFSEYQSFANDPKNEFFPQVRGIMALLVEKGVANDLQGAYDMAVGMHADVRKELIGRAVKDTGMAQKQASAANLSVRGAPGGVSGAVLQGKTTESVRDSLERVLGGS